MVLKSAKNADQDKYLYSGFGTGFDTLIEFSLRDDSVGKNVIILGINMNSSFHMGNKGKDILILRKGPTQGLTDPTLIAETQYSINFTRPSIKFCLSLHYNGSNSFLFLNATKIYQFKAKDSEIKNIYLVLRKFFRRFFSQ